MHVPWLQLHRALHRLPALGAQGDGVLLGRHILEGEGRAGHHLALELSVHKDLSHLRGAGCDDQGGWRVQPPAADGDNTPGHDAQDDHHGHQHTDEDVLDHRRRAHRRRRLGAGAPGAGCGYGELGTQVLGSVTARVCPRLHLFLLQRPAEPHIEDHRGALGWLYLAGVFILSSTVLGKDPRGLLIHLDHLARLRIEDKGRLRGHGRVTLNARPLSGGHIAGVELGLQIFVALLLRGVRRGHLELSPLLQDLAILADQERGAAHLGGLVIGEVVFLARGRLARLSRRLSGLQGQQGHHHLALGIGGGLDEVSHVPFFDLAVFVQALLFPQFLPLKEGRDGLGEGLGGEEGLLVDDQRGEVFLHLAGPVVALVSVAPQSLEDDLIQPGRNIRVDLGGHLNHGVAHLLQGFEIRLPGEQALAGAHLEQQRANGKDVGALVQRQPPHLLRGHVAELALEHAGLGLGGAAAGLGDAEVDDLQLAGEGYQHILRADVPVDDVHGAAVRVGLAVGVVQPLADPGRDGGGHGQGHLLA